MPTLLLYLLKANVALVLFYLAYHLVLRKLTFYHLNRLFLVFGIVFSAMYPLVDLTELLSRHEELAAVQSYAVVIPVWTSHAIPEQAPAFDYWLIPVGLFWLGCGLMLLRLVVQFVSLYKIHRASVPATYQGVEFRKVSGISEAFSFWKTIYLNPAQHQSPELESILRHEQIHVNGWHTLDVLLAELSTVFYWFNPGVWLMKKAMKENLEFIADQHVVNAGVDRVAYQYLLLKVVGATQPQIANQFNFPSLKRRIAMMNKMPTNKANRLRLLVVLPLVTVLLVAFRSASQESIDTIAETVFADNEKQDLTYTAEDYEVFLKRNPNVKRAYWVPDEESGKGSQGDRMVVELMSGGLESYRIAYNSEVAAAERKYGKLPAKPARPPMVDTSELPAPPAPYDPEQDDRAKQLNEEYKAFYARNPEIKGVSWREKSMVVLLKSGAMEIYNTENRKDRAAAEKKYGKLPSPYQGAQNSEQTKSFSPPVIVQDTTTKRFSPPVIRKQVQEESIVAQVIMPVERHYFVDGVVSDKDAARAVALDRESIHSMSVYKGEVAQQLLGDKSATGVVSIITKQNKDSRQVQEFNKKLKQLVPPPPAPPAPEAAPGVPPAPPVPPAPAGEQLPPPPPPVRYEGPAIPKAGESRVVETEEYIAFFIWPEEISKQELEKAKLAFANRNFEFNFKENYEKGQISNLKIELVSQNKKGRATATYNAEALKGIQEANNVVVVRGSKKTNEVSIGTIFR